MRFQLLICALCVISATAVEKSPSTPLEAVSLSSNKFNARLFQEIAVLNIGKNVISSPQSAHVALAMTAYGADGFTARQMSRALHLPSNTSVALSGFQSLMKNLNNVKNVTLEAANKVFVNKDFKLKDAYKNLTKEVFQAEAATFDASDSAAAAKVVNDWVYQTTHQKIPSILDPSSISTDTRVVLVNALYFKGKWAKQFDKKDTTAMPFKLNKDKSTPVQTMITKDSFICGRIEYLKADFIEIPYENKNVKMVIIVPDNADTLKDVERRLSYIDYKSLIGKVAQKEEILLFLPKFKIESEIELTEPLKNFMPIAFGKFANFTGMSDEKLYIDQVKQKAYIEVNEEGSEASAATAVVIAAKASFYAPPRAIRVDRPFYFAIEVSGVTLFEGHVYDPLK